MTLYILLYVKINKQYIIEAENFLIGPHMCTKSCQKTVKTIDRLPILWQVILILGCDKLCITSLYDNMIIIAILPIFAHSKSRKYFVVECLTRDRRAAGLSLTGVTVLCP